MSANEYRGLFDLPPLAGLCSMAQACETNSWSVEESVGRWKRLYYCLTQLGDSMLARIVSEPIYELKLLYSHHAYLLSEQAAMVRQRVSEMRQPPLGLDKVPDEALQRLLADLYRMPDHSAYLHGCYCTLLPAILTACRSLSRDAHPIADAPSVRVAKLLAFELEEMIQAGTAACQAIERAVEGGAAREAPDLTTSEIDPVAWQSHLDRCLEAAGGVDGTFQASDSTRDVPDPFPLEQPFTYSNVPRRDRRFRDSYNAGVNPEAFLYDQRFSPQDKTLMMYYKRIRELDVPEAMASILVELAQEKPREFHREMLRQLWDEARHAMMGEIGFAALGIDWSTIPINFTWSLNLNTQLDARRRHGVLFYIEQGLMTRTGKRYEWEVALASHDPLAALFQDFDWADEVLHAQIGRRWYVPQFQSLQQALDFGDAAWSQVMSRWHEYRDQRLTEHRNWWPELYAAACQQWGKPPDPAAMAFDVSYAHSRADLKAIEDRPPEQQQLAE